MSAAICLAVPCTLWQRPDRLDPRGAVERPAVHRHRVDVLQVNARRDRAAPCRAHSRAAPGIVRTARMMPPMPSVSAMVWRRPYFLRNVEIRDGARLVAADLDHADGVVGAVERLLAVARRLDRSGGVKRRLDPVGDFLRNAQPLRVDVEERDARPGERRIGEDVAEQVLGEDRAAGADEGDLWRRHELPSGPGANPGGRRCVFRGRPPGLSVFYLNSAFT